MIPLRTKWLNVACLLLLTGTTCLAGQITPSPRLPDTMPWDVESLGAPPEFEWIDSDSPVRSLFYVGEPYDGKPTRVFAYYASPGTLAGDPTKDKNIPAVVLIHGGGGTAFAEWAELWAKRGYAAIAMDLAGCRPIEGKNPHQGKNRTQLEDGGPGQDDSEKFGSVDKPAREQWPYHAVANVIRAHSLVRSFDGIDSDRTAVTGISWGGYLTCIAAAVDNRFKASVPVYGCGYLHENSYWLSQFDKMTPEQHERWVSLWDPSHYLPAVSMPILFVNGTNDFAYPLDSYMKSFNAVSAQKNLCITVNMRHGHVAGWAPKEIGIFIDQHLRNGVPLPQLNDIQVKQGTITATVKGSTRITHAELHYTMDMSPINKRKWSAIVATIDDSRVSVSDLPNDTTTWFLTIVDERGAVVSSEVNFPQNMRE